MEQTNKSTNFFKKLGSLIGFITEVMTITFMNMSEDELQYWISQKNNLRTQLRIMLKITDIFIEEKEQWRKFYQKHFSLELNFTELVIPERPAEGTWRLLIIAQGLALNQVYDKMASMFKCWKYAEDLDVAITKNIRDTKNAYPIWVRDGVEPDEKYLGRSTNTIDPDMIIGVTLLERMIHEMVYFDETGNHLDIKGVTFCSGSRGSDGSVPVVFFYGGKVRVDWCDLDDADAECGVREAVSI